jgi:hypothetical protein
MRRSISLLLAFLWVATSTLACMPTAAMTAAEMACCKKMAGNCDMGTGNHSCCKTMMNRAQSVATIAQNPQADLAVAAITTASDSDDFFPARHEEVFLYGSRPVAPPPLALKSILKI